MGWGRRGKRCGRACVQLRRGSFRPAQRGSLGVRRPLAGEGWRETGAPPKAGQCVCRFVALFSALHPEGLERPRRYPIPEKLRPWPATFSLALPRGKTGCRPSPGDRALLEREAQLIGPQQPPAPLASPLVLRPLPAAQRGRQLVPCARKGLSNFEHKSVGDFAPVAAHGRLGARQRPRPRAARAAGRS